jgi:CO/xanthine dehydrogenase FAD-binding subunit
MKFGRTAYDFNLVKVATRLETTANETCSGSRIYLGGVGQVPMRATRSEEAIRQQRIDENAFEKTAEALDEFKATPQIHGSP